MLAIDMENLDHLSTAGWEADLYSYSGKEYNSFS